MRILALTAFAGAMLAGLAGCGDGKGGEASAGERRLAEQIVEAGGVIDFSDDTLSQVVAGQVQMHSFENPNLTPEQTQALTAAIRKHVEAGLPRLKEEMAGHLVEAFNEKELQTYHDFVAPKDGEAIKDRVPAVMEKSIAAADEMTFDAVAKAVAELAPGSPDAPASPEDGAAPQADPSHSAAPENPTNPQ